MKTLIDAVADRAGETKARTAVTVETVFAEIAAQLAAGNDVTLPGFGKIRCRAARRAGWAQPGDGRGDQDRGQAGARV
jgi:nucleoid DNA-binding protein